MSGTFSTSEEHVILMGVMTGVAVAIIIVGLIKAFRKNKF